MNEQRLQIIVAVFLGVLLLSLIRKIVKKQLDIKSTLSWIVLIIVLLIVDIFPQILELTARLIGIQLPSNMVFMLAIIFLGVIVLSHTIMLSKLAETNKTLVQEVALLKSTVEKLEKKNKEL